MYIEVNPASYQFNATAMVVKQIAEAGGILTMQTFYKTFYDCFCDCFPRAFRVFTIYIPI